MEKKKKRERLGHLFDTVTLFDRELRKKKKIVWTN